MIIIKKSENRILKSEFREVLCISHFPARRILIRMPVMAGIGRCPVSHTGAAGITGADLVAGTDGLMSHAGTAGVTGTDLIAGADRSGNTVADADCPGGNR